MDEPAAPGGERPSDAARRVLEGYLRAHPHTPLLLLSALAEGADTIVAEQALALAETPLGRDATGAPRIGLVVALPAPLDQAKQDFASPAHTERVRALAARALRVLQMQGPRPGAGAASGSLDDATYGRLAAFLATRSHVLIALWDGLPGGADQGGGTADAVRWFLSGPPDAYLGPAGETDPLRVPDGLRLEHVLVRRRSRADVGAVQPADPTSGAAGVFGRIDEFNRDAEGEGAPWRGAVPPRPGLEPFWTAGRAADLLAERCRDRRTRRALDLLVVAAAAIGCVAVFAHLVHEPLLLAAYLVLFGGSAALLGAARRARIEPKYLVYRSLAEALRVQTWWAGAGIGDRVADHYQPLYRSLVSWVRHALKGLHLLGEPAEPPGLEATAAWARTAWIDDQTRYLRTRGDRMHRRAERARWAFWALVGVSFALGVALLAEGIRGGHPMGTVGEEVLFVAMVLSMAAGALVRAWSATMGYEALHARYEAAHALYARAAEKVEAHARAGDRTALLEVLRSLGRAAIEENTAWLLAAQDRPLEIHTAA